MIETFQEFERFGQIVAAFTLRHASPHSNPAPLNLGLHVGDNRDRVLHSRAEVCQRLDVDPHRLVSAHQVHEDNVYIADEKDAGKGALEYSDAIPETDALITATENLPLTVFTADCLPIFIHDPVHRTIGLVHAGWRGSLLGIAPKTIETMARAFSTEASDCWAAVGPSIGPCCYEVSEALREDFCAAFAFGPEISQPLSDGKYSLDLWKTTLLQLLDAGIRREKIILPGTCSCCRADRYFSHRRHGPGTGRTMSLMMIRCT